VTNPGSPAHELVGQAEIASSPSGARGRVRVGERAQQALIGLVVFTVAFVVLVARYPSSLFAAEPLLEDGSVFIQGTFDGLRSIVEPYQGYLHVAPRLVALAVSLLPPYWWPVVMNAAAIAVTAGVATFIASDRLAKVWPDSRLRLALAAGFVLLPASHELSWHVTYIQWSLAVFLLFRVLADDPRGWVWADRAAVALSGLSSPTVILFAPLYLWRRRDMTTAIVLACAAIQVVAVVLTSTRGPASVTTAYDFGAVLGVRLLIQPLIGMVLAAVLATQEIPVPVTLFAMVVVGGLLAVAASALSRRAAIVLGYAAITVALAGVLRASEPLADLVAGWSATRYFVFAGLFFMVAIIVAIATGGRRQRLAGAALAGILVAGIVGDFAPPAPPSLGWSTTSSCIGGAAPCVVPVSDGGAAWQVTWPGR
jgi:hypothetical protein